MAFGLRAKPARVAIDEALAGQPERVGDTYLDAGSVLTGELRFAGNVRLEGRVEGQIHAGAAVIVGEHAEIDASIEADSLEVFGTVMGDIRVARRTLLHKSARVEGEIQTAGIVVEEGARFKGCILIGGETRPTSPSSAAPRTDLPSLEAVRAEPKSGRSPIAAVANPFSAATASSPSLSQSPSSPSSSPAPASAPPRETAKR